MKRYAIGFIVTLGFLISGGAEAAAPAVVALSGGDEPVTLGMQLETLRDDSGSLSLDQVRAPGQAAHFTPTGVETVNRGFNTDTYWYRTTLQNIASTGHGAKQWVLEFKYPMLDHLDVYLVDDHGTRRVLSGDQRPNPPLAEQLSHRTLAIPFHLEPGDSAALYLRVQTTGDHDLTSQIWTEDAFDRKAEIENIGYGIFYGSMLVMTLYNLLVYLWIRDRAYLYYVLYTGSIFLTIFAFSGHARQFFNNSWSGAPALINYAVPMLISITLMFGALFGREFMQFHDNAPRVHRAIGALAAAALAIAAAVPFIPIGVSLKLGSSVGAVALLINLVAAIVLSSRGQRSAQFYLLAWSPFILMFVLGVIETFGLISKGLPVREIALAGSCIDVTILSLALADRINVERREKSKARNEALMAREQALLDAHRVEKLKGFLPQRVAEMVVAGEGSSLLSPKRRAVTVCVIDLREFTPFAESTPPEEVMNVLREFFETMGVVVEKFGGAVEHFAGDSMLVFFNAPLEISDPDVRAIRAAVEMRECFEPLREKWQAMGYQLGLGIGIANGPATVGAIGFSGRSQYAAIGSVTNLASRLCSIAAHGDIFTTTAVVDSAQHIAESEDVGVRPIKGFQKPVNVFRVRCLKETGSTVAATPGVVLSFT